MNWNGRDTAPLSTWNLHLREIIFVTDVEVLSTETFFKRKAGLNTSLKARV